MEAGAPGVHLDLQGSGAMDALGRIACDSR